MVGLKVTLLRGITFIFFMLALTSCSSNVKESLGLKVTAPDEFKVVARAPLSIPQDFSLPTPTPGVDRPQLTTTIQAKNTLFPEPENTSIVLPQTSEAYLLARAGRTDPNIRNAIEQENITLTKEQEKKRGVLAKYLPWIKGLGDENLLDAAGEQKRLADNQKKGLPATAGETPEVEQKTGLF